MEEDSKNQKHIQPKIKTGQDKSGKNLPATKTDSALSLTVNTPQKETPVSVSPHLTSDNRFLDIINEVGEIHQITGVATSSRDIDKIFQKNQNLGPEESIDDPLEPEEPEGDYIVKNREQQICHLKQALIAVDALEDQEQFQNERSHYFSFYDLEHLDKMIKLFENEKQKLKSQMNRYDEFLKSAKQHQSVKKKDATSKISNSIQNLVKGKFGSRSNLAVVTSALVTRNTSDIPKTGLFDKRCRNLAKNIQEDEASDYEEDVDAKSPGSPKKKLMKKGMGYIDQTDEDTKQEQINAGFDGDTIYNKMAGFIRLKEKDLDKTTDKNLYSRQYKTPKKNTDEVTDSTGTGVHKKEFHSPKVVRNVQLDNSPLKKQFWIESIMNIPQDILDIGRSSVSPDKRQQVQERPSTTLQEIQPRVGVLKTKIMVPSSDKPKVNITQSYENLHNPNVKIYQDKDNGNSPVKKTMTKSFGIGQTDIHKQKERTGAAVTKQDLVFDIGNSLNNMTQSDLLQCNNNIKKSIDNKFPGHKSSGNLLKSNTANDDIKCPFFEKKKNTGQHPKDNEVKEIYESTVNTSRDNAKFSNTITNESKKKYLISRYVAEKTPAPHHKRSMSNNRNYQDTRIQTFVGNEKYDDIALNTDQKFNYKLYKDLMLPTSPNHKRTYTKTDRDISNSACAIRITNSNNSNLKKFYEDNERSVGAISDSPTKIKIRTLNTNDRFRYKDSSICDDLKNRTNADTSGSNFKNKTHLEIDEKNESGSNKVATFEYLKDAFLEKKNSDGIGYNVPIQPME